MLAIVNRHSRDSSEVRSLNWLAKEAEKKDTKAALQYYREAIRVSEAYADGPWLGSSYSKIALLLSTAAQNDSARIYMEKAGQVMRRYPTHKGLMRTYYNALGLYNKNIGNYEEALKTYEASLALGESVIGKEEIAGNYLNMANIYIKLGKPSLAQTNYFNALRIFDELKSETGIAFCYNGLGVQFYAQKNYSKAEYYLKKSLEIKKRLGNKKAISNGLNGLAVLYMDLKNYPEALKNINGSIALSEEFNMKDHLCEALINKGMICSLQNNIKEAQECFAKAKTLAEELQSSAFLAKINVESALIYKAQSKNDKALVSLLAGIKQARQVKNREYEQNAHRHLADLYYSKGEFKKAFDEYEIYHLLFDSLEGHTVKMQLNDMEARYETRKKEAEITLLKKAQQLQDAEIRQKNTIQTAILVMLGLVVIVSVLFFNWYKAINRAKRQLEIERVRNHIAQDLHDDIGSTLSSINIISKMASRNPLSENTSSNFAQIEDHSGKMLSTMADIIWSIHPGNDTLDEIVVHMKEFAAEILEPLNIAYHFEETGKMKNLKIDVTIRKNLFLIFKEALNNAMKYSNCTEIKIVLALTPAGLAMDIIDNGDGFSVNHIKPGNGLNNMKERTALMGGQFNIKAGEKEGTHISVAVAIA